MTFTFLFLFFLTLVLMTQYHYSNMYSFELLLPPTTLYKIQLPKHQACLASALFEYQCVSLSLLLCISVCERAPSIHL